MVENWHSIHVFYYENDKDALILEGVRPLFERLAGRVSAVSFTRHWRFGPHLRLNVRTDTATFTEMVKPAAEEIIGDFLARCPSSRQLDPERELPAHRRLAELEDEKGPLLPWHPDNSISIAPYDRREETLGGRETADIVTDFYTGTTDFVFQLIKQARGPDRLAASFNLMIATAHGLSGGDITEGFVSFRSHAEGFLCGFPEGDGQRAGWDRHYANNANALVNRVSAVVATLDEGQPLIPFVLEWCMLLAPFQERAARLAESGDLRMPFTEPSDALSGDGLGQSSPFHRHWLADPRRRESLTSPGFLVYRLMLNFTYLLLTRIGIMPAERFLLCHLAANAVEECYGISAFGLVGVPPGEA